MIHVEIFPCKKTLVQKFCPACKSRLFICFKPPPPPQLRDALGPAGPLALDPKVRAFEAPFLCLSILARLGGVEVWAILIQALASPPRPSCQSSSSPFPTPYAPSVTIVFGEDAAHLRRPCRA